MESESEGGGFGRLGNWMDGMERFVCMGGWVV